MVPTDPAARTQEASWGRTALLVWARSTLSCSLFLVAIILESLIAGPAMPWEVLPALPLVALLAPLYAVPMAGFSSAISWLLALVRRAYSAVVGNLIVTFPLLLTLGYVWLMLFVLSYAMWFLAIAVTCLGRSSVGHGTADTSERLGARSQRGMVQPVCRCGEDR